MKQTYRNIMEQQTLSHTARTDFAERLKRRSNKPKHPFRAAIIAAALCGALTCTVFAVDYATNGGIFPIHNPTPMEITAVIQGEEMSSYQIKATLSPRSWEQINPAAQKDLTTEALPLSFDDGKALETYLGISLIRNPLLDESEIVDDLSEAIEYGWKLCPELAHDVAARYILSAVSLDESDTSGEMLRVTSHRVVNNAEVFIRAYLPPDESTDTFPGEVYDPEPMINNQLVLNENGEWEWESEHYQSAEKRFSTTDYRMKNGMFATIVTTENVERTGRTGDSPREYTAYFTSDGILYSVKAYAVHDPNQSSAGTLTVLKQILDGFL